jgi:hypothetical protein
MNWGEVPKAEEFLFLARDLWYKKAAFTTPKKRGSFNQEEPGDIF